MAIDLSLAASIAEKIVLLGVGAFFARLIEMRERMVAFYGHVGEFRLDPGADAPPGTQLGAVHTHTVVIRNAGRRAAHNVRVPHRGILAPANIHVSIGLGISYTRQILPGGQEEILFPVLVPRQQVTISYLHFPPITFQSINLPISSDEGMARTLNVLPTPQSPRWLIAILWSFVVIGIGAVLYGLLELYRWGLSRFGFF